MGAKSWPLAAVIFVLSLLTPAEAGTFPDFGYTPPAGWTASVFELSQEYPQQLPAEEQVAWKTIDFQTQPREYMQAVIAYCFEGNLDVDFVVQQNAIRKWYHAPWLHWGQSGRDFVRGLTLERLSRRFELAATQDQTFRNFAVGFYNPRGGHTIGRVWQDPNNPNVASMQFAEDTVSFKLLFTTAPAASVPYLDGSPEWAADIDRSNDPGVIAQTKVRLLQIDIAVRDSRSANGGWVFGTFHFDSAVAATSPWERLRPLSLMWGNDPTVKQTDFNAGQRPSESWINAESPIVIYRSNPPMGLNPPRVLGWAGRANGPVDNPASSCLSCHSTAQIPAASGMVPRASMSETEKLRWFRNLAVGEPFDAGSQTLDFSLQLGVGIQNHQDFLGFVKDFGGVFASRIRSPRLPQFRFSRDPDVATQSGP